MDEAEWPFRVQLEQLSTVFDPAARVRKFHMLNAACCRQIWTLLTPTGRQTVEVAERYADGKANDAEYRTCWSAVDTESRMVARPQPTALSYAVESGLLSIPPTVMSLVSALSGATWAAALAAGESGPDVVYDQTVDSVRTEAERIQGLLIECIFGNPFRPVAFAPSWRSETAVALAAGIYSERAFDRLPVLADALEEAGCDDPDVLSHLRGPGPHARGCWVVDAVLGKA